jgi:hypothetical protein
MNHSLASRSLLSDVLTIIARPSTRTQTDAAPLQGLQVHREPEGAALDEEFPPSHGLPRIGSSR